jgi:centractin
VEPFKTKSLDYLSRKEENHQVNMRDYRLPDGNILKMGVERSQAPEILFKPELIGLEYPGVHEMVVSCI